MFQNIQTWLNLVDLKVIHASSQGPQPTPTGLTKVRWGTCQPIILHLMEQPLINTNLVLKLILKNFFLAMNNQLCGSKVTSDSGY